MRAVPPRPLRVAEQVRYKFGRLDFESGVMRPLLAARRAALGARCASEPRFLIRVDEFPHYLAWDQPERYGTQAFARFHEIMADAGVPYLVAVLPRISRRPRTPSPSGSRPLADDEVAMLERIAREGVTFALHGRDHRSRFTSPHHRSELGGLSPAETEDLLERALGELATHRFRPDVFVPPFNRFDAEQFATLARRFRIVCGGPESIGTMGFQPSPQWRGQAVYLPSYRPFYDTATEVLAAAQRAIDRAVGLWLPVVFHWGWEMDDDWQGLRRFVRAMAPYVASWEDFQAAAARSRA